MEQSIPLHVSGPLASPLFHTQVGLHPQLREALTQLLAVLPPGHLHRLVTVLQQYITITLFQQQAITQGVEDATKV